MNHTFIALQTLLTAVGGTNPDPQSDGECCDDDRPEPVLFSAIYLCDAIASTKATSGFIQRVRFGLNLSAIQRLAQSFMAMLARQVMDIRTRFERRNVRSARDRGRNVGSDGRTSTLETGLKVLSMDA